MSRERHPTFEETVSYNFTGAALTPVLQWRVIHFGSHENTEITDEAVQEFEQ